MLEYPPSGAAARIKAARVRAGLSEHQASEALGITLPAYYDLESFDDEVFTCLSLDDVLALARLLRIEPLALVVVEQAAARSAERISLPDVVDRMRAHIVSEGLTTESFSNRVGWDIAAALAGSESAWQDWNLDCLHDVCAELQTDWMAVLRHETE